MKFFKMMASLALIVLGAALILSGLHVLPGAGGIDLLHQEIGIATAKTTDMSTVSQATGAQLVGYGSDKDTYSRGDTAKGYIVIKNTGSTNINDVTVSASVARGVPLLGTISLGSKDFTIGGLNIGPGETKRAEFAVSIPGEVSGISTAGGYDLKGNVLVGGQQIGSFSKHITVV